MPRSMVPSLFAAAVACLVFGGGTGEAHRHEPRYQDIGSHWAKESIEILWEEGHTDGYMVRVHRWPIGWVDESRFLPDQTIQQDEWTTLAAKVFDLEPIPGHPVHRLPNGKNVAGWLAAAREAGWPRFGNWKAPMPRQEIIHLLMTALKLEEYAESLSESAIRQALSRYKDEHTIRRSLRSSVAAATILGIVEGYPDRTFRPERLLTRAEAATILVRSALARAHAEPNPFYPDGDGVEDVTEFTLATLRNRNTHRWRLIIQDNGGGILWSAGSGSGSPSSPPSRLVWEGITQAGTPLPPGTYYYRFSVWDRHQQRFDSALKPLRIGWRRLEGSLSPETVRPGESLHIRAETWGDARSVSAEFEHLPGTLTELTAESESLLANRWRGELPVPPSTIPGTYRVRLRADFGNTERERSLPFRVEVPVHLEATLYPAVLPAGALLTVEAWTSEQIQNVRARFRDLPDEFLTSPSLDLARTGPQTWQGQWTVPLGIPEGIYRVTVVGESPYGEAQVELSFQVQGDVRELLRPVLTD